MNHSDDDELNIPVSENLNSHAESNKTEIPDFISPNLIPVMALNQRLRAGWKSYTIMLLLLLLGLLAALGQHGFYTYLNGREVDQTAISQTWVIRVGTAFAFLCKTALVAAIGISFSHGFWYSVRRKSIPISAIDAIYGVLQNPLQFFAKDFLVTTKVLGLLAAVCWVLPFAAIVSPGALTVTTPLTSSSTQAEAPFLSSLDTDVGFFRVGASATYAGATNQLIRIAGRVLITGEIIAWPSTCGSNCTYNTSFVGPSWQCLEVDPQIQSVPNFTLPAGSPLYYAADISTNDSTAGLWIISGEPTPITLNHSMIHCSLYEATYYNQVEFLNNLLNVTTNLTVHGLLPAVSDQETNDLYFGANGSDPELWSQVNMYTIHNAVVSLLEGAAQTGGAYGNIAFTDTEIGLANFVDITPFNISFPPNFPEILENLLINTTLSLTYFLQRPPLPQLPGFQPVSPAYYSIVSAETSTYPARYNYSARVLWEAYSVAIACSFISVLFGCYMLLNNGVDSSMSFSQVLVTTRNSTLDHLTTGMERGGGYISQELKGTRIRYGILRGEGGHVAFGLDEEIRSIKE